MSGIIGWIIGGLLSWAWSYVVANWIWIAAYLIGAAIVCALVRKFLALYGKLPLVIGVCILVGGAWSLGYWSGPVRIEVRTKVKTVTVEKLVADDTALARLRKQMAAMLAAKDAEIARLNAALRNAEAALAQVRQELAAAKLEIQRLLAELAKPPPAAPVSDANGQCPSCNHFMHVRSGLKSERIRCSNCGLILPAKSAWAHREYMLNRQQR